MTSTWLTLSIRRVVLPCSNSRTKRSPTPVRSARSICVRPSFLRAAFTKIDSSDRMYTLWGINIFTSTLLYPKGIIFVQFIKVYPLGCTYIYVRGLRCRDIEAVSETSKDWKNRFPKVPIVGNQRVRTGSRCCVPVARGGFGGRAGGGDKSGVASKTRCRRTPNDCMSLYGLPRI